MVFRNLVKTYLNPITLFIYKSMITIAIPGCLVFVYTWQNVSYAQMNRKIRKLNYQKDKLIRKNNELKVDIASSTSARRMEALYKKIYHALPSPRRNRIITITLPEQSTNRSQK